MGGVPLAAAHSPHVVSAAYDPQAIVAVNAELLSYPQ